MSRKRKDSMKYLLVCVLIVIALGVYIVQNVRSPKQEIEESEIAIHYIDVGQGTAAFIENGDHDILIDTGTDSKSDALTNYLLEQDVEGIEYLFLSHPHEDHIGGADEVFDIFEIEKVVMPEKEADTACFRNAVDGAENENAEIIYAVSGDEFEAAELDIKILSPEPGKDYGDDMNLYSLVIQVSYGERSFVFTGDAEEENERYILDEYGNRIECDILSVGHHGSSTSSCKDFIKALDPEIAVISCGDGNEYGHPHVETLETLKSASAEIYRTDRQGDIVFICDGNKIREG